MYPPQTISNIYKGIKAKYPSMASQIIMGYGSVIFEVFVERKKRFFLTGQ